MRIIGLIVCLLEVCMAIHGQDSTSYARLLERLPTTNREKKVLLLDSLAEHPMAPDSSTRMRHIDEALSLSQNINYLAGQAASYRARGFVHQIYGTMPLAQSDFEKALSIARQLPDKTLYSRILIDLGKHYHTMGVLDKAQECLVEALPIFEKLKDTTEILAGLSQLGAINYSLLQFDQAIDYFHKAYALSLQKENIRIIESLSGLAIAYIEKPQPAYDSALAYINIALKKDKEYGENPSNELLLKAAIFARTGNISEMEKQFTEVMNIPEERTYMKATILLNIASLYAEVKMGKKAIHYGEQGLQIARDNKLVLLEAEALHTLCQAHILEGHSEEAYTYLQRFTNLRDSLSSNEKQETINRLQIAYETEKKEQAIAKLREEKAAQRRMIWLYAVIGALAVIALLLLVPITRLRTRLIREKTHNLEREAEVMQEKIAAKNRELATAALYLDQKNKLLLDIKEQMLQQDLPEGTTKDISKVIDQNLRLDDDWDKFKMHFDQVHPDFFQKLLRTAPTLTKNELRQCAYIKIGLSQKEAAALLGINPDSVKVSRFRIKKKLGLGVDDSLTDYILNL